MTFRVSPGVYPRIIDDSLQATYVNPSIAAVVGGALRGPLGAYFVPNYQQRLTLYGYANPTWGYMIDASDAYLLKGTQLWMDRVVAGDAMYSLGLIANNWTGGIGGTPAGTSFTTIPGGTPYDYTDVNLDVHDIELTGQFVSGCACTVTINGTVGATVPFATSHNLTMASIQQAIITTLNSLGNFGWCDLPLVGSNYQILRVIGPNALTLTVSVNITGAGAPSANVYEADWLCAPVSENPGSWSAPGNTSGTSGVAVGITNIDLGVPQRVTVSLASAVLTGQTINMNINGTLISAAFTTNNNTTVNNFCAAYVEANPTGSAAAIASGGPNNLQFVLVAPNAATTFTITAAYVSGTGSLPLMSYAITLQGTASTGSFNFVVYENNTFTSPDEVYLCTYGTGTDGLGNPTQLDYVINGIPQQSAIGATSPRVRVVVNPLFSGQVNGPTNVTNSGYQRWLGGGADGSIPSTSQVVTGWGDFSNPDAITIRILINAGYTDAAVHQEMISLASTRMDCFAILDVPSNLQASADAVNYRQNVEDVDSFWGALYSPDILVYDANMGVRRYVPPSGLVAGQYAYNDQVQAEWWSPAGLTRGVITQALGARVLYEEGDRDLMSQAQINCIRKYGSAWTIWGEYTLQQAMSALQSVAVVRMMITVMTECASLAAYSVFEPNNPYTWNKLVTQMNSVLGPIKTAEGITDFYVQCDGTNNTPDIIDERVCLVALWIKPTLSILYLRLDGIVTRQSAVFSVEMAAANNQY